MALIMRVGYIIYNIYRLHIYIDQDISDLDQPQYKHYKTSLIIYRDSPDRLVVLYHLTSSRKLLYLGLYV